ncbi:DnaA N-terminal domain-containing protein [Cognatishimia activa]|uniref:Chromosomal replication initiation protein n=1 Tax=Cognatishimia activa TaxID=1715691 RepID=A0A0P1IQR2_9RHOB|nr:DnaA N-terminal domain-containing protein [Cognatishimia activa]CUJ16886.1 chromosomal replication initiation protein [Cognatishimia activa]CUK25828.1 chromosomal replication initiation protein [Cognatishimia activa]
MSRGLLDTVTVTGPGAASAKYDVLSALLVLATQGEGVEARLALRLSLLITARYNWRRGHFAVGQKELARMWGVTERTVKREMAELRGRGWITVDIPAARGRVASYKIDFNTVLRSTAPFWDAVGPDFAARVAGAPEPAEEVPSNVVPLPSRSVSLSNQDIPEWLAIAARLKEQDPKIYNAWFAQLDVFDCQGDVLRLVAPSRFVSDYVRTHFLSRLMTAALAEGHKFEKIEIQP